MSKVVNEDGMIVDNGCFDVDFRTKYSSTHSFFSDPGREIIDEYGLKVDKKTGNSELAIIGQTNFYEKIQADKEFCDIKNIIKRFENGEIDVFNQRQGSYFDSTDMPQTYAEMQERIIECNRIFENLPVDIKEQFNNSAGEFWQSYGTVEWSKKMGFSEKKPVEKSVDNVDISVDNSIDKVKGVDE